MKFSDEELMFLIQSTQHATIKGKDALLVANILTRLTQTFEKRQEKAAEQPVEA